MKLGDKIEILGFDDLEPALLIVVKKIIGNKVKDISEAKDGFESIKITLKGSKEQGYELGGVIIINKIEKSAYIKNSNLFFAINALFEDLQKDL
jgi:hypothetical protein